MPPLSTVPAGEFVMGSDPRRETYALNDEKPQHRVRLAAFQIARYPVTVAEYACAVHAGVVRQPRNRHLGVTWQTQLGRLDHPVVGVTWHEAVAYTSWLADLTGQGWRLPTEAEWELAARGTKGLRYPWGDTFERSRCNTYMSGISVTTPVGCYSAGASPYSVQDMAGNVWEWTSSLHKPYQYRSDDGRERGDVPGQRALRGGAWNLFDRYARTASRFHLKPDDSFDNCGFRLACGATGT
jgi:formylglycine-generating enzyme required for sulfatase activity